MFLGEAGTDVTADLWYRCYGVTPVTDYLADDLAPARRDDGYLRVTPFLQVLGHDTVFAVGDISDADRNMAGIAGRQAALVTENITSLISGQGELAAWETFPSAIVVPIGPDGGSGQLPGSDELAAPELVAQLKGRDMFVDRYAELLGAELAPRLIATTTAAASASS
jgi:NADH dehydrogenase FAD-containing subunit